MKELLYRKIYLHLKAEITGGGLPEGERLPGVREIAQQWNTSPNTVLKSLTALESDGLICKTRGQGIFVQERSSWRRIAEKRGELGIILHDMNEPFNLRLLSAVEKSAAARGYRLSVYSSDEPSVSGAAGFIIVPSSSGISEVPVSAGQGVPVIYTGVFSPPRDFRGHYVITDLYSGVFSAAELLLESGRERLAYISGTGRADDPGRSAISDLLAGTKYGFHREYAVAAGGYEAELGRAAMENLLMNDEYPDAVLCASDALAAGAVLACREAGLSVPSDVCIVGSGDQDIAPLLNPPLTSLRVPAELLGAMAAGFIDDLIRGVIDPGEKIRCRLDPELVIRGSALGGASQAGGGNLTGDDGIPEDSDDSIWL